MAIIEIQRLNMPAKQFDLHAQEGELEIELLPLVSTAPGTFYRVQYIILAIECQENFMIMSPVSLLLVRID
jgi:hypothetical protein